MDPIESRINNAVASLEIEGLQVTEEDKVLMRRCILGELSYDEAVETVIDSYKPSVMSDLDYSDDEDIRYCYPGGTNVLRNKPGLMDGNRFSSMESTITGLRMLELDSCPQKGSFNLIHLKAIHKRIFGDIFEWAGEIRTVDISKSTVQFCRSEYIEDNADKLFKELAEENHLKDLDGDVFVQRLAYYFSEINVIHPFREGNGRTQRKFIEQLAREAGHFLSFEGVGESEMIHACEYAMFRDESKLEVLLSKCINSQVVSKIE